MRTLLPLAERVWPGSAHSPVERQLLLLHTLLWLVVTVAALQHPLDGEEKVQFHRYPQECNPIKIDLDVAVSSS